MEKNVKRSNASGILGLVVLAVASPLAVAADSGWYGGFNVGQSHARIDDARITNGLLGAGIVVTSIVDDDRDVGYKLFGGYQFNRNFAVEGGYFNLGKFGFVANTTAPGTLTGTIKLQGLNLDAVGMLPLGEKFSAFARAGVNYAEARDTFRTTGVALAVRNPNPTKRDTNYKYGLGLQYDFTPSLGMRAEAERYRIDDAVGNKGDVDLFSVGLVYRFGGKTMAAAIAPRPAAVPEPRPVAPAPAPRPAAVTPPPPAREATPPPPPPLKRDRN